MLTIENKFNIGDECYSYYRKPVHYKCPICEGEGKFSHNGHEIWCKKCNGSGKIHDPRISIAEPCKVRIKKIRIDYHSQGYNVKYGTDVIEPWGKSINSRPQSSVFSDLGRCQEHCDKINQKEIPSEF